MATLILHITWLFCALASAAEPTPPWWEKPETLKKIREQHQVMVVVKEVKPAQGPSYYSLTGAGNLRATRAFTLQRILAFDELQKISPYFKKVVHQPELKRVFFLLEAYGYEARLLIKYRVEDLPEKTVFHWNVVWGGFQGMIGTIELKDLKADKTEAVLKSQFDDKEIPLPKIFKSFALELVIHHVAKGMRRDIEERYAKTKGQL